MTENPTFPCRTMSALGIHGEGTTMVKIPDKIGLNPCVKNSKAFQVISPEVVMHVLCKRIPIVTTSGVYDDIELYDAEGKCFHIIMTSGTTSARLARKES